MAGGRTAVIGVDVGGTTISAGVVTPDGTVVVADHEPTARRAGHAEDTIAEMISRMRDRATRDGFTVTGAGVGVPGPVDPVTGQINDHVPHVPELAGLALGQRLSTRLGLPVFIDNDVNALALGEWMFGAGRGVRSLVVLAPGTGFGCGVILDGRLVRGVSGFGGEFGHTPVKFDGRPCWCGGRGCLAVYASGRGIAEAARARVEGAPASGLLAAAGGDPLAITAPVVFRAAENGDAVATAIVDEACHALGAMIATIINGLNPERVVITGGVAESFAAVEKLIMRCAAEHAFARAVAGTHVAFVPSDKRTTMRGAAALVLYETGGRP
jgi:glucokinase